MINVFVIIYIDSVLTNESLHYSGNRHSGVKKKTVAVQEKIYLEELTNKAKLIEANSVFLKIIIFHLFYFLSLFTFLFIVVLIFLNFFYPRLFQMRTCLQVDKPLLRSRYLG